MLEIDEALVRALGGDPSAFEARYAAHPGPCPEHARDIARQNLDFIQRSGGPRTPWGSYLVVDDESAQLVGACAFKGVPTENASVEIAYHTFEPFEGRGYASAMALALVGIAERSGRVASVLAHTLPQASASTRVLEKAGLRLVGEVLDPEDSLVWRWQRVVGHGPGSDEPRREGEP
jgi:RimJ/RimL family protein N-acetyltransferase